MDWKWWKTPDDGLTQDEAESWYYGLSTGDIPDFLDSVLESQWWDDYGNYVYLGIAVASFLLLVCCLRCLIRRCCDNDDDYSTSAGTRYV